MFRRAILASALICSVSSAALAADQASQTPPASSGSTREQMTTTLQQSGFTDVKVMPDAFLVSAKDKSGNPVTMFINPNSMTEVIGTNASAQSGSRRPLRGGSPLCVAGELQCGGEKVATHSTGLKRWAQVSRAFIRPAIVRSEILRRKDLSFE